jgi:hypothetical protein
MKVSELVGKALISIHFNDDGSIEMFFADEGEKETDK